MNRATSVSRFVFSAAVAVVIAVCADVAHVAGQAPRGSYYYSLEEHQPYTLPSGANMSLRISRLPVPPSSGDGRYPLPARLAFEQTRTAERAPAERLPTPPPTSSSPLTPPANPTGAWPGEPRPAEQPRVGDHFPKPPPCVGPGMGLLPACPGDFSPDPIPLLYFDPCGDLAAYDGKKQTLAPYPPVVWFRPFYSYGLYPQAGTLFGKSNLFTPQFIVYGDWRTAVASNDSGANEFNVAATRINLDFDLKLTSTERLHAAVAPLQKGNNFTRVEFNRERLEFIEEVNFNPLVGYFEGDLGAIAGGMVGKVLPFDAPVAAGAMPLVFQNGTWFDDVVTGFAYTLTAQHSQWLDISNYDLTFMVAWDGINSPAFQGDNGAAKLYGVTSFVEAWGGYMETGYGFLEDRSSLHRSYHNIGWSWTRRYGNWLSNSLRVIGNVGQSPNGIAKTADGVLFLVESSLITDQPSTFVPYCNLFAGLGRPQAVARNAGAGGVLVRSGILFETDGLTNYPTLDASGADSWGAALGLNLLPADFSQQLVVEVAYVDVMQRAPFFRTKTEELGAAVRYQKAIRNDLIFRADAMIGFLSDREDVSGLRVELRQKF